MKQVEVTILGQSYLLGCPDGGEKALLEAVAAVDREMSAIRDGGKVKARERIAVLAALNLAFALAERPDAEAARWERAGTGAASGDEGSTVDVAQLIRRLDMALGADGQLL
jgi:cell division protein ZapA